MKSEELLHWADEKEVVSTNKPIKLALNLISHLPAWSVFILVFPVSFFYLIASRRARHECRIYQKQLREFSNGSVPKRISPYAQIVSFSKLLKWTGFISSQTNSPMTLPSPSASAWAVFNRSNLTRRSYSHLCRV